MGYYRLSEGAVLSASQQNQNWSDAEELARLSQGDVVLEGLSLIPGPGFTVTASSGKALLGKLVSVPETVIVGFPPSSTTYVWLRDDAVFTLTPTLTKPAGVHTLVGSVTTGPEGIIGVDTTCAWKGQRVRDYSMQVTGPDSLVVALNAPRVGIGTDSPSDELHVSGIARADALVLMERLSAPTALANRGFLYTKEISGTTELFYRDDKGNDTQLTESGALPPGTFLPLSGGTMLGAVDMNSHSISGLPAGLGPTDAVRMRQLLAHSISTYVLHTVSWAQIQNTTRYYPLIGYRGPSSANEVYAQVKLYDHTHVFRNLRVYVSANSTLSASSVVLRADGSDTALSVNIPAGQTGTFENLSNEVVLADGSLVNYSVHAGAGGTGLITIETIQVTAITSDT